MILHGKCHCGIIAFALDWQPDPASIPARACDCSFCIKHRNVWTSHSAASLSIIVKDSSQVSLYRFGTKTADFHVCSCCGVTPVVSCSIDGNTYAVVNINTFERVDPALIANTPSSFDGEGVDSRLERRKRNWIANVRVESTRSAMT